MRTVGIICEYNPFHSGHRHQLSALRETFGADCGLVCVMSGNWVQRGEPALADKWLRAEAALRRGADLILELPTLWAVSSAETFARGGVALLTATGVVDVLCFGSEHGALAPLMQVADTLDSTAWRQILRQQLDAGQSFPVARQKAAEALLGGQARLLQSPNNNLGIEYLRALRALNSRIVPHTIQRVGAAHDDTTDSGQTHVSASYLREIIRTEDPRPLQPYLTEPEEQALRRNPAALSYAQRAVLARLRSLEPVDFAQLPDSGEGLADKLCAVCRQAPSLDAVYSRTKSKRYTHARIRRLVLWAFLGLTEAQRPETPPYLRVLGFSPRGQQLLKAMKTTASLPILTKPAHAKKLPPEVFRLFDLEARSTSLYDLCRKTFGQEPTQNEYTQNPVRL